MPLRIPQSNPKAGYLAHKGSIDAAVARVLDGGWYILGPEVSSFEQEFGDYLGVPHAVGVANGTDALALALRACGVGAGDLVLTVSHTAVATVAAIESCGAAPVFVDVAAATFTMDPEDLERALADVGSGQVKAVIPVHLYGYPADISAICRIAERHHLYVIEDCAQAHGAAWETRKVGTWGDLGTFSFYPTKNLPAFGDGGAVVCKDDRLAERVKALREYGWQERYVSHFPGLNSRLDTLQAAILRARLPHLDYENSRRRDIAGVYSKELALTSLVCPVTKPSAYHVYHQYVVRSKRRDALRSYLDEVGIGTLIHYPVPVHLQPAYRRRLPFERPLPVTEALMNEIVSLPMFPQLLDDQVRTVAEHIRNWVC